MMSPALAPDEMLKGLPPVHLVVRERGTVDRGKRWMIEREGNKRVERLRKRKMLRSRE